MPALYSSRTPPRSVRDAYYDGLPGDISSYLLSNAGFGWHAETAIHILRLVLSGTLDRNPGLKLIIGHLGELLPMLLKRVEETFGTGAEAGRQRTVSQTILDQVWITTSWLLRHVRISRRADRFQCGSHPVLGRLSVRHEPRRHGISQQPAGFSRRPGAHRPRQCRRTPSSTGSLINSTERSAIVVPKSGNGDGLSIDAHCPPPKHRERSEHHKHRVTKVLLADWRGCRQAD